MVAYRNHPGGMGQNMSQNIARSSAPVSLESVIAIGNRAQRRWAKKKLAEQLKQKRGSADSGLL